MELAVCPFPIKWLLARGLCQQADPVAQAQPCRAGYGPSASTEDPAACGVLLCPQQGSWLHATRSHGHSLNIFQALFEQFPPRNTKTQFQLLAQRNFPEIFLFLSAYRMFQVLGTRVPLPEALRAAYKHPLLLCCCWEALRDLLLTPQAGAVFEPTRCAASKLPSVPASASSSLMTDLRCHQGSQAARGQLDLSSGTRQLRIQGSLPLQTQLAKQVNVNNCIVRWMLVWVPLKGNLTYSLSYFSHQLVGPGKQ